ncbi:hypothetical protein AZE42_08392 [Rhizopogon vesiculosus]|uniref:Uncharacterized protein n=1 Tax=Rhizopogon vesiculosus TaxID=180088 RepID=A0A1J8Q829_9AGAM|nr:hypothetical protein AZE42_08392 [Rhizopogon vesiculosus]
MFVLLLTNASDLDSSLRALPPEL